MGQNKVQSMGPGDPCCHQALRAQAYPFPWALHPSYYPLKLPEREIKSSFFLTLFMPWLEKFLPAEPNLDAVTNQGLIGGNPDDIWLWRRTYIICGKRANPKVH